MQTIENLALARQPSLTTSNHRPTDKERKIAGLISQSRLMRGLPLLADAELRLGVSSWARVLKDVPIDDLDAAFDRAVDDAPTGEPFGAPHLKSAYAALLEERARERKSAAWRNPGTFRCWLCQDEGFQQVLIYCPTWKDWFGKMRPCGCEAQPLTTRLNPVEPPAWERGEKGIWQPVGHAGLRCGCLACSRKRD